jgi:hypothetical protein
MQAAERQLHLRLDADDRRDVPSRGTLRHVAEERALARAGLSAEDEDAAATRERVGQNPVEGVALATTPEERHRAPPFEDRPYTSLSSRPFAALSDP